MVSDPRVTDPLRWKAPCCINGCLYTAYARSNVSVMASLAAHVEAAHLPTSASSVHTPERPA